MIHYTQQQPIKNGTLRLANLPSALTLLPTSDQPPEMSIRIVSIIENQE